MDYIKKCQKIVNEDDLQAVVIVTVHKDGTIGVHTNGDTREHKDVIGRWGQDVFAHSLTVIPFRTIFGWGNKGVPKDLNDDEYKELSLAAIDWKKYIETGKV